MDNIDKQLINKLQDGIAICESPFANLAAELGLKETEIVARINSLREQNIVSRFGPMYDIARMGGEFTLCALKVPENRLLEVERIVNAFPEVAHNYLREHQLNMWFVLATENVEETQITCEQISQETGLEVLQFPKLQEFFIELKLVA